VFALAGTGFAGVLAGLGAAALRGIDVFRLM